ncbi:MAG: SHOCT domain-containing protein [Burkholderiales bacterium]
MFYDGGFYMAGMHALWWLFWVVLIGVLAFYAWRDPGEQRRRPRETPHDVLQRRLANGEIAPDEYEKRKALLDRDASPRP